MLTSVLAFGTLFGLVGAIIGVPIAAGLQIVFEELTAGRRARIAAADAASREEGATADASTAAAFDPPHEAEASPVERTMPVGA